MIRKFFPLDKNYLLEQAQVSMQDGLLTTLVEQVKRRHELLHNPLGLRDTFNDKLLTHQQKSLKPLYGFYQNLAGIYRYKHGHNQLEFLWDGSDHMEKYKFDWAATFHQWTEAFCEHDQFLAAVLDLTVFLPVNRKAHLAENRMNAFITQVFELKIHKHRGIIEMNVA